MTQRVLVTGATGFIGRQLVPMLAAAGYTTRALARAASAAASSSAAEVIAGTLPDRTLAERLCANVDTVIHAAGLAHVNADPAQLRAANLEATLELAQAAREQGVRRFIFLSSSKARYPLHSAYAQLKAEAETELRKLHHAKFEVVCIRPALVYGRGMRGNLRSLLKILSRPWLPAFPGSAQPLGMISVHDLCRALLAAVQANEMPNRIWELADGQAYTLNGIVRGVRETLGLPPPLVPIPRELFRILAWLASMSGSSFSLSTWRTLFEEAYEHDAAFSRHTGFCPEDTFFLRLPDLLDELH